MLDLVIPARRASLGDGLEVGRVLPYRRRRMVGPFVFLDHMGPMAFDPGHGMDVRPHPHIGLATVTYLLDGEIRHRDSLGTNQLIRPGELNWMTAGAGIVHSERTDPARRTAGAAMHGLQAWVALPETEEETPPAFAHHDAAELPEIVEEGAWARLIAGSAYGEQSPVRVRSPLFYLHVELAAGARLALPTGYPERAAYVVTGAVGHDGTRHEAGQLLVFAAGGEPVIVAEAAPARVMLLGGEPIGERFIWWNFVSSRRDRIEAAKADWRAGRMILPPDDAAEFIPLPEEPPRPPRPIDPT